MKILSSTICVTKFVKISFYSGCFSMAGFKGDNYPRAGKDSINIISSLNKIEV